MSPRLPYVYISGALSDLTDEHRTILRRFYEDLAEVCERCGLSAYLPHRVSDPKLAAHWTPKQVDDLDRQAVTHACLVLAVVTVPSTGVGIEIELAHHANKPVILLFDQRLLDERKLSRLVRGNPSVIHEIGYTTHTSALTAFHEFLSLGFIPARRSSSIPELLRV